MAVTEAQAMGLPVVCSDADGLRENVAHGVTGFAVPRRDVAAMADALHRLAADPGLRTKMGAPPVTGRNRNSTTASSSIASRPSTAACWRLPRPT